MSTFRKRRRSRTTASTCSMTRCGARTFCCMLTSWRRPIRARQAVDGQSFEHVESEGREKRLQGIRSDLRDKTYKPRAVRRVLIPKPGGGERPLGIPTIRDRVVQTAAKLLL